MSESDSSASVFKSRPKTLAALMKVGSEEARLWLPEELEAIFRHQMSAPVVVDLGGFDPASAARLNTLSEAQGLVLKSFNDLFHHPCPPVELLRLTKDFAKSNLDQPESLVPREIAAVLYYSSLAAALAKLGIRMSKLGDEELRRGFTWARGQKWVDAQTRTLLSEALGKVASGDGTSHSPP
jgi:hypothetical protein